MKNINFIASFLFIVLFIGCSSDDNDKSFQDNSLNGQWYLKSALCFCGFPDDPKFEENELDFNVTTSKVIVTQGSVTSFIDAGTYDYTVREDKKTMLLNGVLYIYEIADNGDLTLYSDPHPNMVDDEVTLIYTRHKSTDTTL